MLARLEAIHFRCLKYASQTLRPFQILIGPNASGKTTFLDVVSFLGTLVSSGLEAAFQERSDNPLDLLWGRQPGAFEAAIEARIPEHLQPRVKNRSEKYEAIRYEVRIAIDAGTLDPSITAERVLFKGAESEGQKQRSLFPEEVEGPKSLLTPKSRAVRFIVNKVPGGNDNFYSEVYQESGKGWAPSVRLGPRKSALGNLPADESKFPVSTWLKGFLQEGVQRIILNSLMLRQASPPGRTRGFRPDGSNLPWVVRELRASHPRLFEDWVAHLRTALPDLEDIRVVIREDDKHAYLVMKYRGGLETPSWVVSDGTLRILALTVLAYLPEFRGVYLIEEPENGIHPTAVETVYQSLSSVYHGQVLVASHSPVLLGVARPEQLLCFARTPSGATDIVRGDHHPALRGWRNEVSLGAFFASGILG